MVVANIKKFNTLSLVYIGYVIQRDGEEASDADSGYD